MKRVYFSVCLSLLCMNGLVATAQEAVSATKPVIMYGGPNQRLIHVSPNGKWACGAQSDGASETVGFVWNLEADEITNLGVGTVAYDVSNDGIVVGTFPDSEASGNGAEVEAAGYWIDGQWHHLENYNDSFAGVGGGSVAMSITADGTYIGGAIYSSKGVKTPVVWKNFKLIGAIGDGNEGEVDAITEDGTLFGGWGYTEMYPDTRQPVLWTLDGIKQIFPGSQVNPYQRVVDFTTDGNKALYIGVEKFGERTPVNAICDLATGESVFVPAASDNYFDYFVTGISDSLSVVGYEQAMNTSAYPIYYKGGKTVKLESYLIEKGVDFDADGIIARRSTDSEGLYNILQCTGVSADDSTFLIQAASVDMYEIPVVVKLNANAVNPAPAGVKASVLSGINVAKIEWKSPLVSSVDLAGYNVYRNGEKLNAEPIDSTVYYDNTVAAGSEYTYYVTADFESGKTSAQSDKVAVSVPADAANAPTDLHARMKGYNDVLVSWREPQTNNPLLRYYEDGVNIDGGFGGSNTSFEAAVRFDKGDIQHYSGYKLTSVRFCPKEEVLSWAVNIYSGQELVYTQPITQQLQYGHINTVKLNEPLPVPQDGDLYIAIQANVASTSTSSNIVGMTYGTTKAGYSDLIRTVSEESWFYSLNDRSENSGGTGYPVRFIIGAELEDGSVSADANTVSSYNVYCDGALAGSSETTSFTSEAVADGDHTYSVEAVYANGDVSGQVSLGFTATANTSACPSIDKVAMAVIDEANNTVKFSWEAPLDNDATNIEYCGQTPNGGPIGPAASGYGYQARTTYMPSKLRSYGGYEVKQLRFYPLANAEFTFYVLKDGQEITSQYVEKYDLNKWNTVTLDEPFVIDEQSTYDIIIDCFDVDAGMPAMAVDNTTPFASIADLVSIDEGKSFVPINTITGENSSPGNWLMGMVASLAGSEPMPIEGYNVRIDANSVTEQPLAEPEFTYEFGSGVSPASTHAVNVDVIYSVVGTVEGSRVFFTINDVIAGIGDNVINDIKITREGDNYIRVEGDGIQGIDVYSVGGSLIGSTSSNVVNVSAVQGGLYILKVKTANGDKTYKVRVSR